MCTVGVKRGGENVQHCYPALPPRAGGNGQHCPLSHPEQEGMFNTVNHSPTQSRKECSTLLPSPHPPREETVTVMQHSLPTMGEPGTLFATGSPSPWENREHSAQSCHHSPKECRTDGAPTRHASLPTNRVHLPGMPPYLPTGDINPGIASLRT